jgi:hypothetical protein
VAKESIAEVGGLYAGAGGGAQAPKYRPARMIEQIVASDAYMVAHSKRPSPVSSMVAEVLFSAIGGATAGQGEPGTVVDIHSVTRQADGSTRVVLTVDHGNLPEGVDGTVGNSINGVYHCGVRAIAITASPAQSSPLLALYSIATASLIARGHVGYQVSGDCPVGNKNAKQIITGILEDARELATHVLVPHLDLTSNKKAAKVTEKAARAADRAADEKATKEKAEAEAEAVATGKGKGKSKGKSKSKKGKSKSKKGKSKDKGKDKDKDKDKGEA